jgi:hypothetical protein
MVRVGVREKKTGAQIVKMTNRKRGKKKKKKREEIRVTVVCREKKKNRTSL